MDPDDTTAIIDMKKNFQRYITGEDSRKRSRLDISDTSLLDASQASINQSFNRDADALSVKTNLMYCKSRIGMLETQLTSKDTELKEQAILHERELSELKRQHDRELRGYSVLKTSHERVLHRQELCEAELSDEKANMAHIKQVYDEKIKQLQKRNMEQDVSYTQQLDEQKAKCRELRNKLLSQQADLSVANSELAQIKEQFSEIKKKLNDSLSSSYESDDWKNRATQAEEQLRILEAEKERYKDDLLVMSARKQDLAKLGQVTEENKKLNKQVQYYKATVENIDVMREQLQTMERRTNNYENLQDQVALLQVENENFAAKLSLMQQRQIPEDTVERLREAQEKEAVMLGNIGELKSQNRHLESKINELENSKSSLKTRLTGAGDEGENKNKHIERLQRKIFLLTKERDGYRKILESYDSEVTREVVPLHADKATQLQITLNSYIKSNEQLEQDILFKEKENLSLKHTVTELEAELASKPADSLNDSTAADKVDQSQLLELREKVEKLEREYEKVLEEKEILEVRNEQRNMQGDYDPTKTKVLHLSMNPASLAQKNRAEEVRLLREDNRKLRERIKVLEGKLADAHDITMQVEANLKAPSAQESKQLADYKAKLTEMEMRSKRMMEVFSNTSKEFRQVVYRMTGYRIDIPANHQYKLMNMYGNSPEDFLLFNETGDGDLQLLETDYASTLTELAEEHLYSQNSIPVFLSSLTLDLYKQQTMMTSMI